MFASIRRFLLGADYKLNVTASDFYDSLLVFDYTEWFR